MLKKKKKKNDWKKAHSFFFNFFKKDVLIYFIDWSLLPLTGLSLGAASKGCYPWASRLCGFLVAENQLQGTWAQQSWLVGSLVVVHGLSRSTARGIFPDQGSNPCALHCKVESQPPDHQGSPKKAYSEVVKESS